MPGSFAALIPRGVWNMDSPNFAQTAFSEIHLCGILTAVGIRIDPVLACWHETLLEGPQD
jgi:hypothetical protein